MPWISGISSNHMRPTRFSFTYAIFCAAALCLSSGAKAQTPGSTELFNWTGFYIGGNIGGLSSDYGFGHYTDTVDVDAQFSELPAITARDPFLNVLGGTMEDFGSASFPFPDTGTTFGQGSNQALLGGGQVGYNKQFGHWVIGVEGDYEGTSASGKTLSFGSAETTASGGGQPIPLGAFTDTAETTLNAERKAETDWSASLRARFGYAVGPLLFYGTAGIAWTDVKVIASETASTDFFQEFTDGGVAAVANPSGMGGPIGNFIGNVPSTNFSKTSADVQMGWTGGCGSEWAINDKMSLAVEYRHSDYGSHTYHFASNEGVIFPGDTKVSLETDQVTLRFNILISHFFGH